VSELIHTSQVSKVLMNRTRDGLGSWKVAKGPRLNMTKFKVGTAKGESK
jgi:hypothetical protein